MAKPSEPKRVSFTTISSMTSSSVLTSTIGPNALANGPSGSSAAQKRFGGDIFGDSKSAPATVTGSTTNSKNQKSVRLNLNLTPTDKANYPEINYAMLMRLEEKKRKKLKQKFNGATSSTLPFEENDDDVARIAAELEKKYGNAYGRGRGRSKRDDQCDIGLGYDENDSFIDNTDAYDEIIPEEVETIEGGFYINCGALEFKQLNSESVKLKTDEIIKMPKRSKKRALSTSSSSSNDSEDSSVEGGGSGRISATVPKSSPSNGKDDKISDRDNNNDDSESSEATIKSKNKHKKDKTVSSKKLMKQISKSKEKPMPTGLTFSSSNSPKPTLSAVEEVASDGSEKERLPAKTTKSVKTTTVKDMLKAKRDSFLKMQGDSSGEVVKIMNGELRGSTSKSSEDESSDSSGNSDSSEGETDSNNDETSAKVKSKPMKKSMTQQTNEENADKMRTTDTKLPELEPDVSKYIQTFKEIVKSKNILGKRFQFDEKLTDVFLKIDESLLCIEKTHRTMVFAHLEYHLLLPRNFFVRKAKQLRIKEEKLKSQRALAKLRKAVIEAMPGVIANYEVEIRKYTEMQNAAQGTGPGTSAKIPKKKFPWNTNLRNLLYEVYQTRWTSFPVLCTRKENLEEFITVYLKDKVLEIWPSGWMRYEDLQKEIEKRKQSSKKSKEKKTENINSAPSASNAMRITPAIISTIPTNSGTTANAFSKQFEEFASNSRSCGNSDNDSVSSNNTSNMASLKRKNTTDDLINSKNKVKSAKLNNNQVNINQNTNGALLINNEVELIVNAAGNLNSMAPSVGKQMDFGSNSGTAGTAATSFLATNTNTNTFPTQHSNISKPVAHVIDLDQYNSAIDILEKSKELQKATNTPTAIPCSSSSSIDTGAIHAAMQGHKRTSSTDSDGVEFIGVYQAQPTFASTHQPSKPKSKKSQQQPELNIKSVNSINSSTLFNNNNNNNKKHISAGSSSIQSDGGLSGLPSSLEDMERLQKSKALNPKEFTQ